MRKKKYLYLIFFLISIINFSFTEDYIRLEPEIYYFKPVRAGKIITASFEIYNTSTQDEIIKIQPTCGCLVAVDAQFLLPAGGKKTVPIKFNTNGYSGQVRKEIIIMSDLQDFKPLLFAIEGMVKKPFALFKLKTLEYDNQSIYTNNFHINLLNNTEILYLFAYKNCLHCQSIYRNLKKWISAQKKQINLHFYLLEDPANQQHLHSISEKIGYIPKLPFVIYNQQFYSGKTAINLLLNGQTNPPPRYQPLDQLQNSGISFRTGLKDAFNPSAWLLVMVLISCFWIKFVNRWQFLLSGVIYIVTIGLFIFFTGSGVFINFQRSSIFTEIIYLIKYGLSIIWMILAGISILYFNKTKKDPQKYPLNLPNSIQSHASLNIRFFLQLILPIIGLSIAGLITVQSIPVSSEQANFTIIRFLLQSRNNPSNNVHLIILYTIGLIFPLITVLTTFYLAIHSKKLTHFLNKHIAVFRLFCSGLFLFFMVINLIF